MTDTDRLTEIEAHIEEGRWATKEFRELIAIARRQMEAYEGANEERKRQRERAERAEAKLAIMESHCTCCEDRVKAEKERDAARADLEAYQAVGDLETCQRLKQYYQEARAQAETLRALVKRWVDGPGSGEWMSLNELEQRTRSALAGASKAHDEKAHFGPCPAKPASGCQRYRHEDGPQFEEWCDTHGAHWAWDARSCQAKAAEPLSPSPEAACPGHKVKTAFWENCEAVFIIVKCADPTACPSRKRSA